MWVVLFIICIYTYVYIYIHFKISYHIHTYIYFNFLDSCKNAFAPHPTTGRSWDLVFNCAAETRPNQTDAVYKEGIHKLSLNCANEAMFIKAQRYIEFSTGCVNSSEKYPLKEDCKHDPWTSLAKHKLKVEKELQTMENFNYTIIRLPVVYGCGDKRYLSK